MIIRTETGSDHKQVYELNYLAFGNRDSEAKLVERIRSSAEFIPELSIVAEADGHIVGHLLLSKAKTVTPHKEHEVIVLAPIAVRPDLQKQGIGLQLMTEGLQRTKHLGYGVILLIGHPTYYPKFGFQPARRCGYELTQFKVSDDVFMVCEAIEGQLLASKGELRYPESFFG